MAAALIGVGGSVIVAVVGFLTTRAITGETLRASSAAAREGRLWDKRSAAYEAALAELASRQVRQRRVRRLIGKPADTLKGVEALQEYFATRDTPGWAEMQGRLLAYASKPVLDALEAARTADEAASRSYDEFVEKKKKPKPAKASAQSVGSIAGVPIVGLAAALSGAASEAFADLMPVWKAIFASTKSDRALIERIRAELQGSSGEIAKPVRSKQGNGDETPESLPGEYKQRELSAALADYHHEGG
jgi:hypothetical protein